MEYEIKSAKHIFLEKKFFFQNIPKMFEFWIKL